MILAAFGVVHAAVEALDGRCDTDTLAGLDAEDLAAAWQTTASICRIADDLYSRLRAAVTDDIARRPGARP